jgi:putative restriction endonuclease
MRSYVGITDWDWFELLSSIPNLEEVNFWQPGGTQTFQALSPGELFLFKLHSPQNYIVGGGFFAHSTRLPISLAWEAFATKNGARTLPEMKDRVAKYRRQEPNTFEDYTIGCILLEQPFFLPRERWVPVPPDWKPNIVQGKRYDLTTEPGKSMWSALQSAAQYKQSAFVEQHPKFGKPVTILPRLGQGSFRVLVTDAYERRCAVTNERTLPALDAAHIKPYAEQGEHHISNGLLLRRDLHALFDRGYVTVTPEFRVEISRKIKEEFENGRDYYRHQGALIRTPSEGWKRPNTEYLQFHNEKIFRG